MRLHHLLFLRHGLLAALMLALLSVPFAHRVGAAPVSPQMAQFIAAGGTLADICGMDGYVPSTGCEACKLAATLQLPAPVRLWQPDLTASAPRNIAVFAAPRDSRSAAIPPPVRAPPV